MKFMVNGTEREIDGVATLHDLLGALGFAPERPGMAVARNEVVVPRARWVETPLAEGDRIEIITAVQGG